MEQCLTLAQRAQEPVFLLAAHHMLGAIGAFCSEGAAACTHLEQARALYDPQLHPALILLSPHDPEVGGRSWLSFMLWVLGGGPGPRQEP